MSTIEARLSAAVAEHVPDGSTVFLGGFGHAVPGALVAEVLRQGKRDLTVTRSGCDVMVDMLIARGCARKVIFGWIGNPGFGLAHAFRRAFDRGTVEVEEWTNFSLVMRLEAARLGLPFLPARVLRAGDARGPLPSLEDVRCPYTGEVLAAVPALDVDVALVHAQRADVDGNLQLWGVRGDTATGALAARKVVATVERIVDRSVITATPNLTIVPADRVAAVIEVPFGAHPSYVHDHYLRDDDFYARYDAAARTEEGLEAFIAAWLTAQADRARYVDALDDASLRWVAGGAEEVPTDGV